MIIFYYFVFISLDFCIAIIIYKTPKQYLKKKKSPDVCIYVRNVPNLYNFGMLFGKTYRNVLESFSIFF